MSSQELRPRSGLSRRRLLGTTLIGGIAVHIAPLGSPAYAALFDGALLTEPDWNGRTDRLKYRTDGRAKVTGAKIFARDIRARDMPHWPQQQAHALILRIGRWSSDDFWRALHDGVRRDGQLLYPAMPYTSYRGMTRQDADAIYAYLMQLRPMSVPNIRTELDFPYDIRLGMMGWKLLLLSDSLTATSAGNSAAWQRGRYLVKRAGPLRRMPYSAGHGGRDGAGARLDRVCARSGRGARHHAGRARRARLDGRRLGELSRPRDRRAGFGLRRHASGRDAQHPQSRSG
jgi:hypothetical protein